MSREDLLQLDDVGIRLSITADGQHIALDLVWEHEEDETRLKVSHAQAEEFVSALNRLLRRINALRT